LQEIGTRLSELAHKKDWSAQAGVLTDDVIEQLVPQGTYSELPAVLASRYERLCDGIAIDTPSDPDDDAAFAAMVDLTRSIPAVTRTL
jgi:hypothetical protein